MANQLKILLKQAAELSANGDLANALVAYQQALAVDSKSAVAWRGLADIYVQTVQFDKAIPCLEQACQLHSSIENLLALVDCFNRIGYAQDGQKVLDFALKRYPQSALVIYHSSLQLIRSNQNERADRLLSELIDCADPLLVAYAYLEKVRIDNGPLAGELERVLLDLYARNTDTKTRMVLAYALTMLYDKLHNYQKAAEYMQVANTAQLSLCQFKTSQMATFFNDLQKVFEQPGALNKVKSEGQPQFVPVFIVGMPRTGSTLLEQMLVSHSKIDSVGEANYLARPAIASLEASLQRAFPHCITGATQAQLSNVAERYYHCVGQHHLSSPFVINKLPANFQNIGLIMQIFPNAKIIDIRRNTKDVGLSIYRQFFAQNEPYFCDLQEFAQYHRFYLDLMTFWEQHFAEDIYRVEYEELVRQPKAQILKLLDFLTLEFEPDCLMPHKNERFVDTLSATQVKQPIHLNGHNKWQHYAAYLPLLNGLN